MSSSSNVQPAEGGRCCHQKALLSEGVDGQLEPEENEDEDVDFNPFLKETPLSEASSSLSSENEGLGGDVVGSSSAPNNANLSSKLNNKAHDFASRDSENDEEVVMQTRLSPEGSYWEESEAVVQEKLKKRKLAVTFQQEVEAIPGKENTSSNGTDAVDGAMTEELLDPRNPRTSFVDLEEEDAICRRTRARYSLANFTLDELETFLQESDDEADLQHADDEQEYRKFLAAVLQGGDIESETVQENVNVDDEDEENDADFEIEIEEALESELDDSQLGKCQKNKHEGVGRRPETRQNRSQKASVNGKKNLLGLAKRPLRPLLPFVPNTQMAPFPALDLPRTTPETGLHFSSSSTESCLINGFTQHQIGQLYCLIHEHMQLLIQVFSLCVLEPSRQHIATEVQGMISEMVHKRDEVLAWRNVPYPGFCFRPPCIHSSVSDELPQFYHGEMTADSSFASNAQKEGPSTNNMMPVSHSNSHSDGRIYEHAHGRQVDPPQTAESSLWVPLISRSVLSILDVAPLRLVGGYMAEVSTAVKKYQQRHVEGVCASFEKEPLFPLPTLPPLAEANSEVLRGATPQGLNTSSPGSQQPKKTLAATLVESTKKQSVAHVQKDIVKLVRRFFPLFNSALFPHKPPPVAVANRVLFTDAEDELLALGLMEYNNDWKAIQQRFLPCKSKHQIFVRQKNRCSSKAPENPIKAVRRMKTSPLTSEEKARIHEALRVFKLDWISIWRFIVPYRDPSLLPRQWRVALGTQKSYKSDTAKKEKRRLYESMRRKSKAAVSPCWQTALEKEDYPVHNADGENNSGDDNLDDEDEAYVHEAFLADWRPGNSRPQSSELPQSSFSKGNLKSGDLSSQDGACAGVGRYGETRSNQVHMHEVLRSSIYSQHLQNVSHFASVKYYSSNIMASNHLASDLVSKSAKKQVHLRPYRVRRSNAFQLVKLAPDLPPVNLPPSVRVISQSAFKSYCSGSSSSTKTYTAATAGCGGGSGHAAGNEDQVPRPNITRSGTTHSVNAGKNKTYPIIHNTSNPCSKVSGQPVDQHVAGEKRAELDLQMHPLLFQASEDGCFPYYPSNCGATSGTLSLLPGNQLQANFDLFCKPRPVGPFPSTPGTIEFHPLLQNTDDVSCDSVPALSVCHRPVESLHGLCAQPQHPESSVPTEPHVRSDLSASCTIPARLVSPSDKANELDLEIHLSSTSRKEKVMGNRVTTEHNSNDLQISGADCGITMGNQRADGPSYQGSSQDYHAVSVASEYSNKGQPQGACPMVLARRNLTGYAEDMTGQQSPQEIVMEQEELSDSDEELGENVEFECEEMADSDGEGSDFEQFVDLQKEVHSAVLEEDVSNADHDSELCKPRIGMQTDAHNSKGYSNSCKSGLSNKAGDASNIELLVSLDSQALGPSTCSKPKFRGGGKGDDQVGRSYSHNGFSPRPSRSCKRVTPNSSTELHHLDMPNQQHVDNEGTVVYTSGKKTRKRASRNNYTKDAPNCISIDNTGDGRPDDSCPSIEDDARISTPVSSNALHSGCNTGVQGLKEV